MSTDRHTDGSARQFDIIVKSQALWRRSCALVASVAAKLTGAITCTWHIGRSTMLSLIGEMPSDKAQPLLRIQVEPTPSRLESKSLIDNAQLFGFSLMPTLACGPDTVPLLLAGRHGAAD